MVEYIPAAHRALLEKAEADLARAKERFEGRQKAQLERMQEQLDAKLKNFDVYVESVMDSKRIKLLTAKHESKKKRIQDEMEYTQMHYKEVRANMIKRAQLPPPEYKYPLYLREALAKVAVAKQLVGEPVDGRDTEPTSNVE